jgi:hemerythrin
MTSFAWGQDYSLNIEPMDCQHKRIFEYMSAIHEALAARSKQAGIDEMLDDFGIYCKMHFYDEERLMEEMNFPSILAHKQQHGLFLSNLDRFRSSNTPSHTRRAQQDFVLIKEWFVDHILDEDLRYSEFYANRH